MGVQRWCPATHFAVGAGLPLCHFSFSTIWNCDMQDIPRILDLVVASSPHKA